jgi:hypothetical protein
MLRWLCLLAFGTTAALAGPVCVVGTLASYEALGAGGCTLGSFNLTNFTYTFISGSPTIPDTSITVTPSTANEMVGLTFTSPDFTVSGSASAVYTLGYTYDPGDIRSLEDILNDPVVSPGLAQIATEDCENAAFVGTFCPTTTDTITVSDNGITKIPQASVSFTPFLTSIGILDTITLQANGASAEMTGFGTQAGVPEPSSAIPCLLLVALVYRRLRLQRL